MKRYYHRKKLVSAITEKDFFVCGNCHLTVPTGCPGSDHRNHCPGCLWSLHVDIKPGDRMSGCHGLMEPITVWVRPNKEWALVHRCQKCGALRANRIAGDDNDVLLMSLALRPLAMPPFPLHLLLAPNDMQEQSDMDDAEA
jgi:hypothetical protein